MSKLDAVASTMVAGFEVAWAEIRRRNPDVPPVMFLIGRASARDITMKREKLSQANVVQGIDHSSFTSFDQESEMSTATQKPWVLNSPVGTVGALDEVYIGGECLNQGVEAVFAKVLREAAIILAWGRGMDPLSQQGRYHNRKFWECAVEVGLKDQNAPVGGVWLMELTAETKERYADVISNLDLSILAYRLKHEEKSAPKKTKRPNVPVGNRECWALCECEPPRLLEGARRTLELGSIDCGVCKSPFKLLHQPPEKSVWYDEHGVGQPSPYSARSRRALKPGRSSASLMSRTNAAKRMIKGLTSV